MSEQALHSEIQDFLVIHFHQVLWNSTKDTALWDIISKASNGKDVDCEFMAIRDMSRKLCLMVKGHALFVIVLC